MKAVWKGVTVAESDDTVVLEGNHYFPESALKRDWQPPYSELFLRYQGRRGVHFRAGSDCPASVRQAASGLFDAGQDGLLAEDRFDALDPILQLASEAGHELRVYDDALDFIAERRDAERRGAKLGELFPGDVAAPGLADLLKAPLYPYQAEGALFAVRAGRALIARCQELCRERGVAKLVWETAPDNDTAQRLYDGIGAEKSTWFSYEMDA